MVLDVRVKISLLTVYSCIVRVKCDKCTIEIKSGCLTPSGLQWHWWHVKCCQNHMHVKCCQNHLQACLPTFHCTWYVINPTILLCHYKDTMPSVILVVLLHCDVPEKNDTWTLVSIMRVVLLCLFSMVYSIVSSTIYLLLCHYGNRYVNVTGNLNQ